MKIKRLIACLLAAAMVLTLVVVPTHDHDHGHVHAVEEEENVPTITIGTVEANPGDDVFVPMTIENNPGVTIINSRVMVDETGLVVHKGYNGSSDAANDSVMTGFVFMSSQETGMNPVTMYWESGVDDSTANGLLGSIHVTVKEDAEPGRYELYVVEETLQVYNTSFTKINFTLIAGAIIVPCEDGKHEWDDGVTTATCTEAGQTTYTCKVCTKTDTVETGALGHEFAGYVSNGDATCTADGTKTGHCSRCGMPDTVADVGSMLDHVFTNYVSNGDAECGEDGTETAQCDYGCGTKDTRPAVGSALSHSFTNYVSNGDATCTADGTETAQCDHGCGAEDTRADVGSKLPHSFTEYVSDNNATCEADGTKTAYCDYGCGESDTITDVGSKENAEHSFPDEYVSNNDATCTADGTKSRYCEICGEEDEVVDVGSKLGHSFTEYVSDGNATCEADGTKTATCDRCDEEDTVVDAGSKLGHSFTNYVSDGNATCEADGTKTATCDREGCDETHTVADEGSALGHSFTNYVSDGNATCEADGTKTAICDRCDETDAVADEGSALGHNFVEQTTEYQATEADCCHLATYYYTCANPGCNEKGETTFAYGEYDADNHVGGTEVRDSEPATEEKEGYTGDTYCLGCGAMIAQGQPIEKLDHTHDMVKTDGNEATCTEPGNIEYWTCTKCGNIYADPDGIQEVTTTVIEPLDHSFTNYVSDNNATCTEDGTKTATCDRCDEEDTVVDAGSKLGHSFTEYVSDNNATCEEDGTETAVCDRCDETDTVVVEGSALGHDFVDYVSDNNATCEEDGTKTGHCSRCDETDTIPDPDTAKGHTAGETEIENEVGATCTDPGSHDEVVYCTVCEKELNRENVVDEALGHSFTEYVSDENATCEEDGTKTAKCDRCDVTDTVVDEGTALGHGELTEVEGSEDSCHEKGKLDHWFCEACGKHYADPEATEEIPMDHTWGEWVETDPASCTEPGTKVRECDACDDKEEEPIPANGHDYEDVVTPPTVDAGGYTTHTCKVCGHSYVDNYTPKLDPSNPPTGDEFQFVTMMVLMLASATGMAALLLTEKKRNRG